MFKSMTLSQSIRFYSFSLRHKVFIVFINMLAIVSLSQSFIAHAVTRNPIQHYDDLKNVEPFGPTKKILIHVTKQLFELAPPESTLGTLKSPLGSLSAEHEKLDKLAQFIAFSLPAELRLEFLLSYYHGQNTEVVSFTEELMVDHHYPNEHILIDSRPALFKTIFTKNLELRTSYHEVFEELPLTKKLLSMSELATSLILRNEFPPDQASSRLFTPSLYLAGEIFYRAFLNHLFNNFLAEEFYLAELSQTQNLAEPPSMYVEEVIALIERSSREPIEIFFENLARRVSLYVTDTESDKGLNEAVLSFELIWNNSLKEPKVLPSMMDIKLSTPEVYIDKLLGIYSTRGEINRASKKVDDVFAQHLLHAKELSPLSKDSCQVLMFPGQ